MNRPNPTPLVESLSEQEKARAAELVVHWLPWLRHEAAIQARRESGAFVLVSAGEMMDAEEHCPPVVRTDYETQYRRGYRHGYGEAMDDLLRAGGKRSQAWDRLAEFADAPLFAWSMRRTGSMDLPPTFAGWLQSRESEANT